MSVSMPTLLQAGHRPVGATVGPVGDVVVFAASLLIGGAAIHASARYATYRGRPGSSTFEHAVLTALLGAVA